MFRWLVVTLLLWIQPQVIRAELIHRDHPESQLREPRGATAADRRAAAASRDWARITRRRLGAGLEFATPLSSAVAFGDAAYVITLYFGTPGQKFTLIADTGSDLVWIQCLPCSAPYLCFSETDPFFNTSASSSYAAVPCNNLSCDPHLVRYNNSQHSALLLAGLRSELGLM